MHIFTNIVETFVEYTLPDDTPITDKTVGNRGMKLLLLLVCFLLSAIDSTLTSDSNIYSIQQANEVNVDVSDERQQVSSGRSSAQRVCTMVLTRKHIIG